MRKKICFIASAPTGIVSFHRTNFEKISEEFDIYVIANFTDKSVFVGLNIKDAYPVNIARRPTIFENIKAISAMYKIFKEQQFDCFVSMSSNASIIASIAGFLAKVPHRIRIFTGQIWANMHGWKRCFFKMIDKTTVALNTELLADGKPQLQYLVKNGILKEGQATVLANGSICGVDIEKFKPASNIRDMERRKINVSEEVVVFSFMGRVNRDKGTFELLEAANRLFAEVNDAALVLIGNMEGLTTDVLNHYPNLQVGKNVILYGFTKEPYHALQLADVFCLPSYREGFGMSAIEAASLALPVICSDAYGLQDSFVPNHTGLQCKVADASTLYHCMRELYFDKTLRTTYGSNGRNRVVEKFNKKLVSTAWLKYMHDLLA